MIPPAFIGNATAFLGVHKIPGEIIVENVQNLIEEEEQEQLKEESDAKVENVMERAEKKKNPLLHWRPN
jgi:hypothetical protein